MILNKWECAWPDCRSTAVGTGGALGLRAVGWFFSIGRGPFCPAHRPDGTLLRNKESYPCDQDGPCGPCKGELEAANLQNLIAQYLELTGEEMEFHRRNAEGWGDSSSR